MWPDMSDKVELLVFVAIWQSERFACCYLTFLLPSMCPSVSTRPCQHAGAWHEVQGAMYIAAACSLGQSLFGLLSRGSRALKFRRAIGPRLM
jgi:hypothetical protein